MTAVFLALAFLVSSNASADGDAKFLELAKLLQKKGTFASDRQTQDVTVEVVPVKTDRFGELVNKEAAQLVDVWKTLFPEGSENIHTFWDLANSGDAKASANFGWENKAVKRELLSFVNESEKAAIKRILNDRSEESMMAVYFGLNIYDNGSDLIGEAVYVIANMDLEKAIVIRISYNQG